MPSPGFTADELAAETKPRIDGLTARELAKKFGHSSKWVYENLIGKGLWVYASEREIANAAGRKAWIPTYIQAKSHQP